jgi:adenosylhomocysteine nucleosidase
MPLESNALLHRLKRWKRIAVGHLCGYGFEISGQPCLLVTSGMGARRAAQAARILIEAASPRLVISFGIAGAVEAELEIGDVVLAEAYCRLEGGAPGPRSPLATWSDAAMQAAVQALIGLEARLYSGTAVTTGGSQVKPDPLGEMLHPMLEMETAGIAQAAADAGIPLLSLRAISDGPAAPIPIDLGEMMDDTANLRPGRLLRAVVRNPKIVFLSGRMMRNSRKAADHAAMALVAALSQPLPVISHQ